MIKLLTTCNVFILFFQACFKTLATFLRTLIVKDITDWLNGKTRGIQPPVHCTANENSVCTANENTGLGPANENTVVGPAYNLHPLHPLACPARPYGLSSWASTVEFFCTYFSSTVSAAPL